MNQDEQRKLYEQEMGRSALERQVELAARLRCSCGQITGKDTFGDHHMKTCPYYPTFERSA